MDLQPPSTSIELQLVIERLLRRTAGPARARDLHLASSGAADAATLDALDGQIGWGGILASSDPYGLFVQTLIAESFGSHVVQLNMAALATGAKLGRRAVAVAETLTRAVRRPAEVAALAVVTDSQVTLHEVRRVVDTRLGWGDPWGRVEVGAGVVEDCLAPGDLIAMHRLVLVAEGVGAAASALALTIRHVTEREQFGAPIASRQAVRHALAEIAADVDAVRLLSREAAALGAPSSHVAMAACALTTAHRRLVPDLHRFVGALGLAGEFDLHLYTGRLRSVVAELGDPAALAIEVADGRSEMRR